MKSATPKSEWTISISPFGYAMYPCEEGSTLSGPGWTDRIDEAYHFDDRDSKPTKLKWYAAVASMLFGKTEAQVVAL